jgi:hypothetical protein
LGFGFRTDGKHKGFISAEAYLASSEAANGKAAR